MRRQILRFALAALALLACAPAFGQALPDTLRSAGVTVAQWDAVQAEVRRVAQQRNVSQAALEAVAQALGLAEAQAGGGRVDVGRLIGAIQDSADRLIELEAQLARLQADEDPAIAALVGQARDAIAAGDLASADAALAQARQARRDRNALRQAQLEAGLLDEAEIIATQGSVATLRGDWLAASALYQEAYETAPEGAEAARWGFAMGWARTRYQLGARSIDNTQLTQATTIFRSIALPLAQATGESAKLSETFYWLGRVGVEQSIRGDVAAAADAASDLQTALGLVSRQEQPTLWGDAQNVLGIAYFELSVRGDEAAYRRAIDAYTQALQVRTIQSNPTGWASTNINLGLVFMARGHAEAPQMYDMAIGYIRAALMVITPDSHPTVWLRAQQNLGLAYYYLGRAGRAGAYERAIAHYQATLPHALRQNDVFSWAAGQEGLADVYLWMGIEGETSAYPEAVRAIEQALTVVTEQSDFDRWIWLQTSLAAALRYWGEPDEPEALERAIGIYEVLLLRLAAEEGGARWRSAIGGLADAWRAKGRLGEAGAFERAEAFYLTELAAWEPADNQEWQSAPLYMAVGWGIRARALAAAYVDMGAPDQARALLARVIEELEEPQFEMVREDLTLHIQSIPGN